MIAKNIKIMVDTKQKSCGYFCIIIELCMLDGDPGEVDDITLQPRLPINSIIINVMPITPIGQPE